MAYSRYINANTVMALKGDDNPVVAYRFNVFFPAREGIRCAWWNGSAWTIRLVEDYPIPGQIFCGQTGLAIALYAGNPAIAYDYWDYSLMAQQLKFARWNGVFFDIQTVDNGGGTNRVGYDCDIAIDNTGMAHISYFDATSQDLKYARQTGINTWNISVVDSVGNVGGESSIAVDASNNPCIFYTDTTNSRCKWAHWNGAVWEIEIVGTGRFAGDIAIDSLGRSHVAYTITNFGFIRYARRDAPNTWAIQVPAPLFSDGRISICIDSLDNPQVAFYVLNSFPIEIRFYRWNGAAWVGGIAFAFTIWNTWIAWAPGDKPDIAIGHNDITSIASEQKILRSRVAKYLFATYGHKPRSLPV
jgi:hypothetical protein